MGSDDELTFGQKAGLKWAGFKKFMYNKEAGTVMGRDGLAWAKLLGFYTVFYIGLAAFWAAMLAVFLQTIDPAKPTWNSYVSTPAIAFIPAFKFERIEYKLPFDEKTGNNTIIGQLNTVWNSLDADAQKGDEFVDCPDDINKSGKPRFCRYTNAELGPCSPPTYGYNESKPCIFMNLNKVWGWEPEEYESTKIPEGVNVTANHISIQCVGEDEEDDKLIDSIEFYPSNGISFGHYPYELSTDKEQQKLFINPIVAAQFSFTKLNEKVRITCTPYAANLVPQKGIYNSDGPTEFTVEFMIKDSTQ